MNTLETLSNQRDTAWSAFLALALFAAIMIVPEMAFAGTTIEGVVCKLVGALSGPTGRAVATLAIIIIGVGALMGKVSWGMAIIVAIGIAIVFGAPAILNVLSGGTSNCAETTL